MAYVKKEWRMPYTIDIEKNHNGRYGAPGEKRKKKKQATPEEIERQNEWQATQKLKRKMLCHFQADDWHIIGTYKRENRPKSPEEGRKQFAKFIENMKKEYKKAGVEIKWIMAPVLIGSAPHFHMVVNDFNQKKISARKIIRKAWTHGRIQFIPMYEEGNFEGLADYFIKQTKDIYKDERNPYKQRYTASRNLPVPEPKREVVSSRTFREEPKPYKGYYIDKNTFVEGKTKNGHRYQRYTMVLIDRGKKEGDKYAPG